MSVFLEEIVKCNSSDESKTDFATSILDLDKLDIRIRNEFNSLDIFTSDDSTKALNANIENWLAVLKKNILEECEGMKVLLKDISKRVIIKEIKKFENEMGQLKNLHMESQNLINKLNDELIGYKGNIKSLSLKLTKTKNKLIEAKYMFNWRLRKEQLERQRFCEKLSTKFHKNSVLKKAFYGWKQCLEITWKNRNNSKIERQAQSVCKQLITEYERQIIELKTGISKLQEENASIQTSRSATQDAVKKALMRGVCALNMETMNILNQNGILTEINIDKNFNNFQNLSSYSDNCKIRSAHLDKLSEDRPRFPLSNINIVNDSDKLSYSSDLYTTPMDNIEITNIEKSNVYINDERSQFQNYTALQNYGSTQKVKPIFTNEIQSIPRSNVSKNSTITIQAGNPTGSHTSSSNSALNISIQRHTNETVLSSYNNKNNHLENPDKKSYKK